VDLLDEKQRDEFLKWAQELTAEMQADDRARVEGMIKWVAELVQSGELTDESFLSDRSKWCTIPMLADIITRQVDKTKWRILEESEDDGLGKLSTGPEQSCSIYFHDLQGDRQHFIYYNGIHFWLVGAHSGEEWEKGAYDAERFEEALRRLCEAIVADWTRRRAELQSEEPAARPLPKVKVGSRIGASKEEKRLGKSLAERGRAKCTACAHPVCAMEAFESHECSGPLTIYAWTEEQRQDQLRTAIEWLETALTADAGGKAETGDPQNREKQQIAAVSQIVEGTAVPEVTPSQDPRAARGTVSSRSEGGSRDARTPSPSLTSEDAGEEERTQTATVDRGYGQASSELGTEPTNRSQSGSSGKDGTRQPARAEEADIERESMGRGKATTHSLLSTGVAASARRRKRNPTTRNASNANPAGSGEAYMVRRSQTATASSTNISSAQQNNPGEAP
jgi:hypothetical protein